MNERQKGMLRDLAEGPHSTVYWFNRTEYAVPYAIAQFYLSEFEAAGFVECVKTVYRITPMGRDELERLDATPIVPPRSFGPFSRAGSYSTPKWQTRVGSDAFLNLPTRGNPT